MSGLSDPFNTSVDYVVDRALDSVGDGIYVFGPGNLTFTDFNNKVHGPYAVVAGQLIPFRVRQINTGTTAVVEVGKH